MNPNEIIVHEVDRDRMCVILDLFRERVCQPSKAPNRHAHGEVLSFDIGRADVSWVGVASDLAPLRPDALRRAVAPRGFSFRWWRPVHLHQHCVVDVGPESFLDRLQVR